MFVKKCSELYDLSGREIVDLMESYYHDNSDAEKKSWRNSLSKLLKIIKRACLGNLYLATEYELPAGGRIDATLLGDDLNGNHNGLVVELKQWSFGGIEYMDKKGFPYFKVNAKDPYLSRHPVNQTKEYVDALTSNHSNVVNGELHIYGCQYIHDFDCDKKWFFSQRLFDDIDVSHLYCKDEEDAFIDYLKALFSDEGNSDLAKNLFLNGEYVTTEMDMEIINKITESPDNIPLWSDQYKIMDYIRPLLVQQANGTLETKHLITISGAAGTGKTIVGFRILAEYWKLHPHTSNNIKCKYTLPKNRTIKKVLEGLCGVGMGIKPIFLESINTNNDLLVVDEAHRITNFEREGAAIKKAQIVFVLQDDRQRVRANEIGTLEEFKIFAKSNNFVFAPFELKYQKRSGLGRYVDRLDSLLYEDEKKGDGGLGLEVSVCDHIKDFESKIKAYHQKSNSTKYYASYCWPWNSKNDPAATDIVIDDDGYRFQKQWNPNDYQYDWYLDSIDQVGCVYTAQGLGFDYVGFIWWDDLVWRNDHWVFDIDKVTRNDYQLRVTMQGKTNCEKLLLNIYRVMLTRAKKGICIWFKDEETKEHFKTSMLF